MPTLAPRSFRILFWLATVFAVTMAVIPQPPYTPIAEFGDKVEHIVAFAVLATLACLGFGGVAKRLIVERLSFLGAAIEVVQSIPALNRDCDVRDWLVDTATVALVALAFAAWDKRRA